MSNILNTIADYAQLRVKKDKERMSFEELKEQCLSSPQADGESFYRAIRKPGISLICEIKKASPSKGVIDPEFDYLTIAREYEEASVDCVSCLTEPKWFLGSDEIFQEVRAQIQVPMLRKDFVIDEYQIWQAKQMGAQCILLICALLDTDAISSSLELCERLGLAALVETHDEREIDSAVQAGAKMIGINNRNLKDFSVHLDTTLKQRERIPAGRLVVAESGVRTPADGAMLYSCGVDGILVGEMLMRSANKKQTVKLLRESAI